MTGNNGHNLYNIPNFTLLVKQFLAYVASVFLNSLFLFFGRQTENMTATPTPDPLTHMSFTGAVLSIAIRAGHPVALAKYRDRTFGFGIV